jgi:hypothetical protein
LLESIGRFFILEFLEAKKNLSKLDAGSFILEFLENTKKNMF